MNDEVCSLLNQSPARTRSPLRRPCYAPPVRMQTLTPDQFRWLHSYLGKNLRRLTRTRQLLERHGYVQTDDYYAKVMEALDRTQRLLVATHYESCEGGVGKDPGEGRKKR